MGRGGGAVSTGKAREVMGGAESCLPEGTTSWHLFSAFISRGHCVNDHKSNGFKRHDLRPYGSGYWKSEVTVSIGHSPGSPSFSLFFDL